MRWNSAWRFMVAEVDRGGFPGWLMKYRPESVRHGQFLRGNSPAMLAWDRHWLMVVAKVVKPHLITSLPRGSTGVILWQLENGYAWYPSQVNTSIRPGWFYHRTEDSRLRFTGRFRGRPAQSDRR